MSVGEIGIGDGGGGGGGSGLGPSSSPSSASYFSGASSVIAGSFRFGGIVGVESVTYTRSVGTSPGIAQVRIPGVGRPLPAFPSPMVFSDGINRHVFSDCLIGDIETDDSDGQSWIITILDRRWRWAYGAISGAYNQRKAGQVIKRTQRTPRQLATLCFEQMGEKRFDVSRMPNDLQPEVNWDMENPAAALDALCDAVGAVVVPRLNDTFAIFPIGVGGDLPRLQGGQVRGSVDFAEVPDEIGFACAPTAWQVNLELGEAVGIEPDGRIVPIDKLSYRPANGWDYENPQTLASVQPETTRKIAQMCVWKWYRFRFPFRLPGYEHEIKSVHQILPILDSQLEKAIVLGVEQRRQSQVYGQFFDRGDTGRNNVEEIGHDLIKEKRLVYKGGWQIDQEQGLIKFSDPTYYLEIGKGDTPSRIVPPRLFLRTSINVYGEQTGAPVRWQKKKPTGYKFGTKPAWIRREEVRHEIVVDSKTGRVKSDNAPNCEEQADYYLKAEMAKYQNKTPLTGTYCGFPAIELDGAIAQVTYTIDSQGYAETQASRDSEHSLVVPSYQERQRLVQLKAVLNQQDKLNRNGRSQREGSR